MAVQNTYPRIEMVRRPTDDGARYFGPYTTALELRDTLTVLRRVFPYRTCKMGIETTGDPSRIPLNVILKKRDRPIPCLDYHLKQCPAPCIGLVVSKEYVESIEGVTDFLKGKTEAAISLLEGRMRAVARGRKFELAAKLRDALKMLQRLQEKQIVSDTSGEDADVFGVAIRTGRAHVVLLQERNGRVIGESSFALTGHAESAAKVLAQFLPQYYATASEVPSLILTGEEIEDCTALGEWLKEKRGSRVTIHTPERGKKGKLLELAEKNAEEKVQAFETKWESAARNVEEALEELQDALTLSTPLKRIEAYDISHLGGTETVGSMAVFVDGKPKNDHYRSFTIRTLREGGIDDYRALGEVLRRRLLHLTANLKQGEQMWKREGVLFRKARKQEAKVIERLMRREPESLSLEQFKVQDFLVARRQGEIIAFGRLLHHAQSEVELKSVWVKEKERHHGLGSLLVRKLLERARREKLKKVYMRIFLKMEEFYARLGFRRAQVLPPVLGKKVQKIRQQHPKVQGTTMVYIFAEHKKEDASLGSQPDLLLIDGGKGQLSSVLEVLRDLHLSIPIVALAKREEEIFIEGEKAPLAFPKDSSARFLLVRLRDEAHRFANAHREGRAKKRAVFSALDQVPSIGPQTRVKLLRKFGSLEAIRAASDEELLKTLSHAQLKTFREQL
jgi:excinuclease UvrABC nuclease subunit/predicted N-acetyltransferase YhbS